MVAIRVLLAVMLIPTAWAGSPEAPELTDESGDQQTEQLPPGTNAWGKGMDLQAVWFSADQVGVVVHIRVLDLQSVIDEVHLSNTDGMFIANFRLDHADKAGPGGRNGEWKVRGDFHPVGWGYWAEGPCLDGDDTDGCAGQDRDIIDAIPGAYDIAKNTVQMTLPWEYLGVVAPGDGIIGLTATTQYVYPDWPIYTIDWDTDQKASAEYRYPLVEAEDANGTVEVVVTIPDQDPAVAQNETPENGKKSPGPPVFVALAVMLAVAARRRLYR